MARLPLRLLPDPILRDISRPILTISDGHRRLIRDMLDTMYHAEGIGLAAPQIGVLERLVVLDVSPREGEDAPPNPMAFINPEILWASEERVSGNEGCLSIPDARADVERHARIRIGYRDPDGAPQELEADGILAVCLQHEIDHLNGVLFIDHISRLKRDMIERRARKRARDALAER